MDIRVVPDPFEGYKINAAKPTQGSIGHKKLYICSNWLEEPGYTSAWIAAEDDGMWQNSLPSL